MNLKIVSGIALITIIALAVEASRLGIPVFVERTPVARVYGRTAVTWRHEVVTVKGKSQVRYRDLKTGRFIKKPK